MPAEPDPAAHALSAADHRDIFDSVIVPAELSAGVPQEQLRVLLLGGQTGAGKSVMKSALTAGPSLTQAVEFGSDTLCVYHPEYQARPTSTPTAPGDALATPRLATYGLSSSRPPASCAPRPRTAVRQKVIRTCNRRSAPWLPTRHDQPARSPDPVAQLPATGRTTPQAWRQSRDARPALFATAS